MDTLRPQDLTEHRPWPLPPRPWVLGMRWTDLLFLHWPVDPERIAPWIPEGLTLETREGAAWLGVVPFGMEAVRPRFVPPVPGVSAFPEINLRTYVTAEGKPGVWFFSLDVTSRLAVQLARTVFHLPYNHARMRLERQDGWIHYASERGKGERTFGFEGRYRPVGEPLRSEPGSLDHWLTERYCLYAADGRGRILRGDIHHAPWPLQRAEFDVTRNSLASAIDVTLPDVEPLAHFAARLDVVAWWPEPVRPSDRALSPATSPRVGA